MHICKILVFIISNQHFGCLILINDLILHQDLSILEFLFKSYSLSETIGCLQFTAINYPLHKTGGGESEGSQHTEIIGDDGNINYLDNITIHCIHV